MKNHYVKIGVVIMSVLFIFSANFNATKAQTLIDRVRGYILLQIESKGEAWYVNPADSRRYYLSRPADAFALMRNLGLGITNSDLRKIATAEQNFSADVNFAKKQSGKILLQIESHGEAWYVYPDDFKRYYLGRPTDAFEIMRRLGLGITNDNLNKIIMAGQTATVSSGICNSLECLRNSANKTDLLLFSLSKLNKTKQFYPKMKEYIDTLKQTENLIAQYLELDSAFVASKYGEKVTNAGDWRQIRKVLQKIIEKEKIKYVVVVGGVDVVPRPIETDVKCASEDKGVSIPVPSELWYIDFDSDQIVDEGLVVSRLPDYGLLSTTVVKYLDTAISLHKAGGWDFNKKNSISGGCDYYPYYDKCYSAPPYCVNEMPKDAACTKTQELYNIMSNSDLLVFSGTHGTPAYLATLDDNLSTVFSTEYLGKVNLNKYKPMVWIVSGCNAGQLGSDKNFSVAFLKAGAGLMIARGETRYGFIAEHYDLFYKGINNGGRVGDEFYNAARHVALEDCSFIGPAAHVHFYGDPTLHKKFSGG